MSCLQFGVYLSQLAIIILALTCNVFSQVNFLHNVGNESDSIWIQFGQVMHGAVIEHLKD